MLIEVLKSKIHSATVTDSNLEYMGSLGIGRNFLSKTKLFANEKIEVYNLTNGNRFSTYVIEEEDDVILINGAAAHLAKKGDKIIIASYCHIYLNEYKSHKPSVLILGPGNKILK